MGELSRWSALLAVAKFIYHGVGQILADDDILFVSISTTQFDVLMQAVTYRGQLW